MMVSVFQVAIGGALGAVARYLTGVAVLRLAGPGFPWATMLVNVAGSILMGILVVVLAHTGNRLQPLLMVGVLGGFTTFSAFSLDAVSLIERGQMGAAAWYMAGSVGLSVLGLFAGMAIARGLT